MSYTLASSFKKLNLITDLTEYPMTVNEFDYGIKLHTYFPIGVNEVVD